MRTGAVLLLLLLCIGAVVAGTSATDHSDDDILIEDVSDQEDVTTGTANTKQQPSAGSDASAGQDEPYFVDMGDAKRDEQLEFWEKGPFTLSWHIDNNPVIRWYYLTLMEWPLLEDKSHWTYPYLYEFLNLPRAMCSNWSFHEPQYLLLISMCIGFVAIFLCATSTTEEDLDRIIQAEERCRSARRERDSATVSSASGDDAARPAGRRRQRYESPEPGAGDGVQSRRSKRSRTPTRRYVPGSS